MAFTTTQLCRGINNWSARGCLVGCTAGSPNGGTHSGITRPCEACFVISKSLHFAYWNDDTKQDSLIYVWAKIWHNHIIPNLNESEEEDVKKWSRDRTKCAETNFRLSSPTSSTSPTCKTAPPCALIVGSVSYVSSARMPKHAKDRLPIRAQL